MISFLPTLYVSNSAQLALEGPVVRLLIDAPVMVQHSIIAHGEHHVLTDNPRPKPFDPSRFYTDFYRRTRIRSPFVNRGRRSRATLEPGPCNSHDVI
jgi:hypothetical protein